MDGLNDVEEMVKTAARWGQPAVAITDHGVVQSFPDAAKTAKKLAGDKEHPVDIKIIYGMEGYLYDDSDCIEEDGTIDYKKKPTNHIILLAATQEGLKNIYKLVSYSHLNYFYKKPRLPRSILSANREGIIVGSACEAGEVYQAVMKKDVVEEVYDDMIEMSLEEAQEIDPRYEIGDAIEFQVTPRDFGRIAAQTAKQVVVQRIREAERGMVFDDFVTRQGEIVTGVVQRKSGDTMFINMGKAEGILPANEQVPGEFYDVNDRLKVYIMDVKKTTKGPQVFLSRSHPGLVKRLFELEVPEIQDGTVEIKSIAREAGSRTKMAVWTEDENIDPVGA